MVGRASGVGVLGGSLVGSGCWFGVVLLGVLPWLVAVREELLCLREFCAGVFQSLVFCCHLANGPLLSSGE